MADNRKETKENQTCWIFSDSMVEDLIEALEASKTECEGRGLDFEGDLVKLYSVFSVECLRGICKGTGVESGRIFPRALDEA